jgi:hypothetical protein
MPSNAKYVGRPTKWGNPFLFKSEKYRRLSLKLYEESLIDKLAEDRMFLEPLRGKDLACFCPLDQPCHVDVLLKYLEISL